MGGREQSRGSEFVLGKLLKSIREIQPKEVQSEEVQPTDEKTTKTYDPERLEDFEQNIREYFIRASSTGKIKTSTPKQRTTARRFIILLICGTAFALSLATLLWFFMPRNADLTAAKFKAVPPFDTIQSFNKNSNVLTISCEERNCFSSVLLPWKGSYQLGLEVPPECIGGIRLSVDKTALNLVGAKRHGDVPDYFLLEQAFLKLSRL